jgi:hypothetical protein
MMTARSILLLMLLLPLSVSALAEPENLALGKKYTFSAWPMKPKTGYVPGYDVFLTDGQFNKNGKISQDKRALVFRDTDKVDIIVDLGTVQPIGEIYAWHDADAYRLMLPRKEQYYVSDDGKKFYKVAEFVNPWDPTDLETKADKAKFFKGKKKFTSGPIKAVGRYVMVRTFACGINKFRVRQYQFAYDEVVVLRGGFDVSKVKVDRSRPYTLADESLPPRSLGYRYSKLTWDELWQDGPLYMGVSPYEPLRDNEYHLSLGGVYVVPWQWEKATNDPITDVVLECRVPMPVKILDTSKVSKILERKTVKKGGKQYSLIKMTVAQTAFKRKAYHIPFLLLKCDKGKVGDLGNLTYTYSYKVKGKLHTSREKQIKLVLQKKISTPAPKRFIQGVWVMRLSPYFSKYDASISHLFQTYKDAGFNSLFGKGGNAYKTAKDMGFVLYANSRVHYCPNGYQFARKNNEFYKSLPEGSRFMYHPRQRGIIKKFGALNALCPALLGSEAMFPHVLKEAKLALATTDHAYANWEPYMYQKRGCVCDRCKKAFIKHSGMTEAEMDKIWPDCVLNYGNKAHNAFTSHQLAQVHKILQRGIRQASKELGRKIPGNWIPAISPREFLSDDERYQTNGSREHTKYLESFTIWGMPFAVRPGVINRQRLIGHNLDMVKSMDATLKVARANGRMENGKRRPEVLNISGIHFMGENRFAMPRVHYFQAVLNFINGMDGHSSYREFGVDARFLRLRAKAARIMATHEDIVLDGKVVKNATVECMTKVPQGLNGKPFLYVRSFQHKKDRLVAVGNDHYLAIDVKLKVLGLPAGSYTLRDRINGRTYGGPKGFSPKQLAAGVTLDIPPKEFRVLELQ